MSESRRIGHIRLVATHEGDPLIKADRRKVTIEATKLNGAIPGFLVHFGGGLERFIPASNVMSAELEHTSTDEALDRGAAMHALVGELEELRANIREVTVDTLKRKLGEAQTACTAAAALCERLPKDGQIARDRKALVDATSRALKLGEELRALIPKAEERPKDADAKRGR